MKSIIGESTTLADTLEHVSLVAPLNRPILVVGERGSGKEMIAERLHFLSKRWDQAFNKLNCAAISETLLDSELFGHEAGSFTGANKAHVGRFERADGGTLFLDELGTMPSRLQEKVLRVIEYGEFERVGGQKTIQVDVRIVAATHEDLPKLADQGKFRHDLLDRLAFDVIHVPPLRERKEDIPRLVDFFATRMCHELERDYYSGFSALALDTLQQYSWPGNIRELKNAVERSLCHWEESDEPIDSVIINPFKERSSDENDREIESRKTPLFESTDPVSVSRNDVDKEKKDFQLQVKQLEIHLIQSALQQNNYHQKKTAESLGLTYHQLRALLKKYKEAV